MIVRIATAGYAYPNWVGGFYPHDASTDDMLAYYATQFPFVEINSTFYSPPSRAQIIRMARRVPAEFAFTLKVPRSASHGGDLSELPPFRAAAEELARHRKLLGLLVQFPESFHHEPASREWLVKIRTALKGLPVAVEFRHPSWDVPLLEAWADRHRLTVVSVSVPNLPTLFPTGLRVSGQRVYARLYSQDAHGWYAGGTARHDYDYPEQTLREWAEALRTAARRGAREAVVVFNNCVGVQAVANARRLGDLLTQTTPEVLVIGPPEPARSRSLFDGV